MFTKSNLFRRGLGALCLLLFAIALSCSNHDEEIVAPPTDPDKLVSEELAEFQKLQSLKQFDDNLPLSELEELATAMTTDQHKAVRVKGNEELAKLFRLKAEDASMVFKIIRARNAEGILAGSKISQVEMESLIDELDAASIAKHNRSFFQLTSEQSAAIFNNSPTAANMRTSKTEICEGVCPTVSTPKGYTEFYTVQFYRPQSIILGKNSLTDCLIGCDYWVQFPILSFGDFCSGTTSQMVFVLYSAFGGTLGGWRTSLYENFLVGRRVNLYGVSERQLLSSLILSFGLIGG